MVTSAPSTTGRIGQRTIASAQSASATAPATMASRLRPVASMNAPTAGWAITPTRALMASVVPICA